LSRTPLFGLIRRSLRAAQASGELKVPLDELLERPLSRRAFVAGTAGALALASCRSLPPARKEADVIIVGAGIAGLTAGYRLARKGVSVRIYEVLPRTWVVILFVI
jgi:NADPH-dependent 2,4-dienoyl-CoA reductase/sulfur reductase-like enzyme